MLPCPLSQIAKKIKRNMLKNTVGVQSAIFREKSRARDLVSLIKHKIEMEHEAID